MKPPVIKDDIYKGKVIDLNHRGQGVVKIDGFAIFIDDGIPGDIGNIKIRTVKKNYAIGEFISIEESSKWRINAPCHVVNECGGCQIQNIHYNRQLDIKKERVINDMKRIGGMEDLKIHDTLGMEEPFRYRNKAQFPVSRGDNFVKMGFYRRGTHDIVDTNSCIIQHPITDKIIKVIRNFMKEYNISPYDEKSGKGIIRHILTKTSFKTGNLMIVIITNGEKLPYKKELINELTSNIDGIKSIIQNRRYKV